MAAPLMVQINNIIAKVNFSLIKGLFRDASYFFNFATFYLDIIEVAQERAHVTSHLLTKWRFSQILKKKVDFSMDLT